MAARFTRLLQPALVILSLTLSLLHYGASNGSSVALLLTVTAQVYLSGYLFARAFGLFRQSDPIVVRLAWIAACGLSIPIVLGALARLIGVPVGVYVIGLHVILLLISLRPSAAAPVERMERKTLPFYLVLALACAVFTAVSLERNRLRYDGYEDQTWLVSLADWWANQPQPENIVSRNIGETNTLTYWSTDGLTYVLAAWVWASGVPAADLVWYAFSPLFAWLVPVIHFAIALKLTKRHDTAAWSVGFTLILALTTIYGMGMIDGFWMVGREASFQLNTLRTFSNGLMLPLAVFAFVTCLREERRRFDLLLLIVALALALSHPRQFLAVFAGLYAILALRAIVMPSRAALCRTLILGAVLLPSLIVPLYQYGRMIAGVIVPTAPTAPAAAVTATPAAPNSLEGTTRLDLFGRDLGLMVDPAQLLFHPFVLPALILSLAAAFRLRHSLTAQVTFAASLTMIALSFVPPLFELILRLLNPYFGLRFVLELFYLLPIGLILGIATSAAVDYVSKRRASASGWLIGAGFAAVVALLLFEPLPVRSSARDQIDARNDVQALRDIQPFDAALLDRLQALPVTDDRVVYLTPNRIANYVVESVPNAFVTGGRSLANAAYAGSTRFFDAQNAPWLDSDDIAFLQAYDVRYLVLPAGSTRVPQILLQPERFTWIDTVAGYLIFAVQPDLIVSPLDDLFARMNATYAGIDNRRWNASGFHLSRGANPAHWQPLIEAWEAALADDPDNDLIRYGLAFSALMGGDDRRDLWAELNAAHADVFLFAQAHAEIVRESAQPAANPLIDALDAPQAAVRVLSARALLSERFFYLLTPEQIDAMLALEARDPLVWSQLVLWDQPNAVRIRAALLMSAGHLDDADRWLAAIPTIEMSSRDLVTRAGIRLLHGDLDAALALLQPATDPDWVQPRRDLHPDRWTDTNPAADFYGTLSVGTADLPAGSLFAAQPQIEQDGDQLTMSALVGNFTPALSPRQIVVEVINPGSGAIVAETAIDIDIPLGTYQPVTAALDLPPDMPPLTPALVYIKPQYSPLVAYPPLIADAVLARPTETRLPADADPLDARFGGHVTLEGYTAAVSRGTLDLTLYWQTDAELPEDIQVTVQVFDDSGELAAQQDGTPVGGRYPTRFWLPDTVIADAYRIPLEAGNYTVVVGMYRLPDAVRLPVAPSDDRVQNDLLRLLEIEIEG